MPYLRALTFDFWGTLYQNFHAEDERLDLLGDALRSQGRPTSRHRLEDAYQHAWKVYDRVWRQEHRSLSVAQWLDEILAFLDEQLPPETRSDLCRRTEETYLQMDNPQPVQGVADVLPSLAARYRIGLISDVGLTPGRVLRELLRRDGMLRYFQQLTFSDEFGMTKPAPQVFLHTLDVLAARPEEAAHIGDLPETDIAGAKSVGMRAVLFLGVSQRRDGLALADAAFERYEELGPLLGRMGADPLSVPSH
jgi:putative hydrolase of the HAD superfamily